jgi:toluene monooxygenase system ferredoxin subunit
MAAFFVEGVEVLVVRDRSGAVRAMDGICPHEDFPLAEGDFDGAVITCINHGWCFDAITGHGINPRSRGLEQFAVKVDDDGVYVDPDVSL